MHHSYIQIRRFAWTRISVRLGASICLCGGVVCRGWDCSLYLNRAGGNTFVQKTNTTMKSTKTSLAAFGLLVAITACLVLGCKEGSQARAQTQTSGKGGFAVVELFTSEGCSSCPPADALMGRLRKAMPMQSIYVLAYHVDYWNHLGWRDRFSDRRFTQRQRQYRSWLGPGSLLYTAGRG